MRKRPNYPWERPRVPRDPEPDASAVSRDAVAIARLHAEVWRRFHAHPQLLPGALVTPRMLAVLRHLAAGGPLTVGTLAEHLRLAPATTTEVVDRLEVKGLVERKRDSGDQRRVHVSLTESGRDQILLLAEQDLDDVFRRVVAALTPQTRTTLISGLNALLEAVEKVAPLPLGEDDD